MMHTWRKLSNMFLHPAQNSWFLLSTARPHMRVIKIAGWFSNMVLIFKQEEKTFQLHVLLTCLPASIYKSKSGRWRVGGQRQGWMSLDEPQTFPSPCFNLFWFMDLPSWHFALLSFYYYFLFLQDCYWCSMTLTLELGTSRHLVVESIFSPLILTLVMDHKIFPTCHEHQHQDCRFEFYGISITDQ